MRPLAVVALAVFVLEASTSRVLGLPAQEEKNEDQTADEDPQGICKRLGTAFCGYNICVPIPAKNSFQCSCENGGFYDANDQICKDWKSCGLMPCKLGRCEDQGGTRKRHCTCSGMPWLTAFCNLNDEAKFKCQEYRATARLTENGIVKCDCGPGMKFINKSCVPVTCLNISMTCEELCRKNLLAKDGRCCQGWNTSNCTLKTPEKISCEPGYILVNGVCTDACTAKAAGPVCPDGCIASANGRPFECKCEKGFELGEDGMTCNKERTVCTEEERNGCRKDQICYVKNSKAKCDCKDTQVERDGVCTNTCYNKSCGASFANCRIHYIGEQCVCVSPLTKEFTTGKTICTLDQYPYVLQFQTNDSSPYSAVVCESRKADIWNALKTLFGKELVQVEQLGCNENFVLRLIFSKKQDPAVIKRIETCQYLRGDVCIFPPRLYLKEASIKPIEDEDLCTEYFQEQLNASKGTHVCRKDGDNYFLQCRDGLYAYDKVTSGRLTRWSCTDKKENIPPGTPETEPAGKDSTLSPREGPKDVPSTKEVTDRIPGISTEQPATKDTPVPDPCSTNPCLNGGVCKPGPQQKFTCECPKAFKGDRCQEKNNGISVEAPMAVIVDIAMSLIFVR